MKLLACVPLLFAGVGALLADDIPLNKSFSFRLEEPTLRPPAKPGLATPPRDDAINAPFKTPENEVAPPRSTPFQFNGQTYYFILI